MLTEFRFMEDNSKHHLRERQAEEEVTEDDTSARSGTWGWGGGIPGCSTAGVGLVCYAASGPDNNIQNEAEDWRSYSLPASNRDHLVPRYRNQRTWYFV